MTTQPLPSATIDALLERTTRYWPQQLIATNPPKTNRQTTNQTLFLTYSIDRTSPNRFSAGQAQMIEVSLQQWARVANITFQPVAIAGSLRFLQTDGGGFAQDFTAGFSDALAYVNIGLSSTDRLGKGNRFLFIALHEIGHALRLKHPGNYNGPTERGTRPFLPYAEDNLTNTVMTYNERAINPTVPGFRRRPIAYPITPMPYDIAAVQSLYGIRQSNTGNTRYRFETVYRYTQGQRPMGSRRPARLALWDSAGVDTLDFSALEKAALGYYFDIRPGGIITDAIAYKAVRYQPIDNQRDTENNGQFTSEYGTSLAYGTLIENVIGSDSRDVIEGNAASNVLSGRAGDDTIDGNDGNDSLQGNAGNDELRGQRGNDTLDGGAGDDFMDGGAGDDWLLGRSGLDNLSGGTGNDTLLGGAGDDYLAGGAGRDRLVGGAGNDFYIVENVNDTVTESRNSGTDLVSSEVSYRLPAHVENLSLSGSKARRGSGNNRSNILVGNENRNTLEGFAGNDTLYGFDGRDTLTGGAGNDILYGGAGRDRLTGGRGSDRFEIETLNDGVDLITDFSRAQGDMIQFAASLFSAFAPDTLTTEITAEMFVLGTAALDANDYILYNQTTGALSFDADGVGGQQAVRVARLAGNVSLSVGDLAIS